ncbi:DUF3027 domain-containing protein [Arthrobacter sp. zg-Y40]|uniref:DUF3027 domain-containing protein n=1 Tax=Arthrobacter sp. zg-Y40 TaxID=2886939 RepID=UPI001D153470|nr:DUF3027 domain-containing protein [Arthrobacter sp. zg-Y40]MCC3279786.1 DUF3027 domain-containing protein [Arthrobacter sp. zg-Y40]
MTPVTPSPETPSDPAARKRAPRRSGKPDAVLAAAVAEARAGLLEVASPAEVGEYAGAAADGERLVTHRFTSLRPGYRGWQWYATVARMPRSKKVTVSEVGLLPSEDALLAPEWVPWSERLRPEDIAAEQEQLALEQAAREHVDDEQHAHAESRDKDGQARDGAPEDDAPEDSARQDDAAQSGAQDHQETDAQEDE